MTSGDAVDDERIGDDLRALDEQQFGELVLRLGEKEAPRLFAVYEVAPDRSDVAAFGWGMSFATRAFFVRCGEERPAYVSMRSPETVRRLFGRRRDLRVCWPFVDPGRTADAPWPPDEDREPVAAGPAAQ